MIPDCPGRFCFHFMPAGTRFAKGVFENIEDASTSSNAIALFDMCGCSFGRCCRESKDVAHADWYEPHEPNLEKAGLPHNYYLTRE